MTKSIGLWTEGVLNKESCIKLKNLHMVLWSLSHKKPSEENILEVGIEISYEEATEADVLCVYFPFQLHSKEISCLHKKLKDIDYFKRVFNQDGNTLIFRDDYTYSQKENSNECKYFYAVSENTVLTHQNCSSGHILRISLKDVIANINNRIKSSSSRDKESLQKDDTLYFRFKVDVGSNIHNIRYSNTPEDNSILSNFTINSVVDIRINETRTLSEEINTKIRANKCRQVVFNQINVFSVLDASINVEHMLGGFQNPRILERFKEKPWYDYIGTTRNNLEENTLIAYQWEIQATEGKPLKEYNLFFKTSENCSSYITIAKFTISVIILGAIGSALYSIAYEMIDYFLIEKYLSGTDTKEVKNKVLIFLMIISSPILLYTTYVVLKASFNKLKKICSILCGFITNKICNCFYNHRK